MFATFRSLLSDFTPVFYGSTRSKFILLAQGALLNTGRQTICNLLRCIPLAANHNWSKYHHFLSRAVWSNLKLAHILCRIVFGSIAPSETILLIVDDTLVPRYGKHVFNRSIHRNERGSGKRRQQSVFSPGHKWVVFCTLVKMPFAQRPWALPVLMLLYTPHHGTGKHRAPVELARLGIRILQRWFPARRFFLTGDGSYNAYDLAAQCQHEKVALVAPFRKDAVLVEPVASVPSGKRGRPPQRWVRIAKPQALADDPDTEWKTMTVAGTTFEVVSRIAVWYPDKKKPITVRWLWCREGNRYAPPLCLMTTDPAMQPETVIAIYLQRWHIEVTFEELRRHLRIATVENWSQPAVKRTVPLLCGLFTLVAVWFKEQYQHCERPNDKWYRKTEYTYSDAIESLREQIWYETILPVSLSAARYPVKSYDRWKPLIHAAARAA